MKNILSLTLSLLIVLFPINNSFSQELVKKILPPITLEIDDLNIDVEFISKGDVAPYDAYLVTPEIMLFLETDIYHTTDEYKSILNYYEETCQEEIEVCKDNCTKRTSDFVSKIDLLKESIKNSNTSLEDTRSSIKWYIIGSAAAGILGTLTIVKVVN